MAGDSSECLRLLMVYRLEQGDRMGVRRQYAKMRRIWKEEWDQELPEKLENFISGYEGEEYG